MTPKYQIGEKKTITVAPYENNTGTITEIRKIYQEIKPDGTFKPRGLRIADDTLPYMAHYFDDDVLVSKGFDLDIMRGEIRLKFKEFSYSLDLASGLSVGILEKDLK